MRIGSTSQCAQEGGAGHVFRWPRQLFSHRPDLRRRARWALRSLIANGHVRASQVEVSAWGLRTERSCTGRGSWTRKSGFLLCAPPPARGRGDELEKAAQCGRFAWRLGNGRGSGRRTGDGRIDVAQAVRGGRVSRRVARGGSASPAGRRDDQSERGDWMRGRRRGWETACTRADERMMAALGLVSSGLTRFERARCGSGALLAGLPALCGNVWRLDRQFSGVATQAGSPASRRPDPHPGIVKAREGATHQTQGRHHPLVGRVQAVPIPSAARASNRPRSDLVAPPRRRGGGPTAGNRLAHARRAPLCATSIRPSPSDAPLPRRLPSRRKPSALRGFFQRHHRARAPAAGRIKEPGLFLVQLRVQCMSVRCAIPRPETSTWLRAHVHWR